MSLSLFTFCRSSAAYRVRIALNLKGLAYNSIPINLVKGEQSAADFKARNPQGRLPFIDEDGFGLGQSLAIIEYLDETHGTPKLVPGDAKLRARIRSFALAIACDVHPLNNLAVLNYLKGPMAQSQDAVDTWYRHWITSGFTALEAEVQGPFVFGDAPTLADICLVPQMYNARRFKTDLSAFPKLVAADARACALPAFAAATPEAQPDWA
jgi:maleylacetoacetate isomerase